MFTTATIILFAAAIAAPPQQYRLCRTIKVGKPQQRISACCSTPKNATGPTCCDAVSPMWEAATVCLGEDAETRAPWLSLNTGQYGSFRLLARQEPAIITMQFYRANLSQRIAFDPGCRKAPPSPECPAFEDVYEELNGTVPIGVGVMEEEEQPAEAAAIPAADVCHDPLHWSGAKNLTIDVKGVTRTFRLSTPYAPRPCLRPVHGPVCGVGPPMTAAPLLIYWHGCNGHMPLLDYNLQISKLEEEANTRGYFLITPVGTRLGVGDGEYGWNSDGINCASEDADDISFFEQLLAFAKSELCLEERRIYLAGFSTGAFLTYGLACRFPDAIAGAAAVAGGLGRPFYKTCSNSMHGAVPIHSFHSLADPDVPYNGTVVWASQEEMNQLWRRRNGCDGSENSTVTFESDTTQCVRWACPDAPVDSCALKAIDHCWYGGRSGGFASCTVRPGDVDATKTIFDAWDAARE